MYLSFCLQTKEKHQNQNLVSVSGSLNQQRNQSEGRVALISFGPNLLDSG